MASDSLSPFVLQKIRERKALKEEPEEEGEEHEAEGEEEHEDEEHEEVPEPAPKKSHHAIGERSSHGSRSASRSGSRGGASLTERASKFFKNLSPTQTWLLVGGGLLLANHLMVPRGTSVLSKTLNAIAPAPKARPRSQSYYSGANLGAGWNRGDKPYGPWAHAAPGGPWPYAHGDSWDW